mmetsp:Transcript_21885/g.51890  ORF Transcript_21885/g.51890 Transcript_21885/m.51890 type:complete len:206 (-) Transcript_21885:461-1078(-)
MNECFLVYLFTIVILYDIETDFQHCFRCIALHFAYLIFDIALHFAYCIALRWIGCGCKLCNASEVVVVAFRDVKHRAACMHCTNVLLTCRRISSFESRLFEMEFLQLNSTQPNSSQPNPTHTTAGSPPWAGPLQTIAASRGSPCRVPPGETPPRHPSAGADPRTARPPLPVPAARSPRPPRKGPIVPTAAPPAGRTPCPSCCCCC